MINEQELITNLLKEHVIINDQERITDPKEKQKIIDKIINGPTMSNQPFTGVNKKSNHINKKDSINYTKIEEELLKEHANETFKMDKTSYEKTLQALEEHLKDENIKSLNTFPGLPSINVEDELRECEERQSFKPSQQSPKLVESVKQEFQEKYMNDVTLYKDVIDETYEYIKTNYNNGIDFNIPKTDVISNFINQNMTDIIKSVKKKKKYKIKDESLMSTIRNGFNELFVKSKKLIKKKQKNITIKDKIEETKTTISDIRTNVINKFTKSKNNTIILNIPKEKYDQVIKTINKVDPSFSKNILDLAYNHDKQKEYIDNYLSFKLISIIEKLQVFSTFLDILKKDS